MSCDNYGFCPKCKYYNNYTMNKHMVNNNLKEWYDIGIDNGYFYIKYYASCEECDFSYSYNFYENVFKKDQICLKK
jgi:hypothetical protein